MITKFDTVEPHLLTGKPRLQEIARILALGILRLHNRNQTQLQPEIQQNLSPERDTGEQILKKPPVSLDFVNVQSEGFSMFNSN